MSNPAVDSRLYQSRTVTLVRIYRVGTRYISNPREPDDPFPWSLASPADQQIPVKVDPGGRSEKGYPKKSLVKDPTGEFLMTTLL